MPNSGRSCKSSPSCAAKRTRRCAKTFSSAPKNSSASSFCGSDWMHRFYISPENWNPDALSLSAGEAHHARDVLRMKRGDRAVLFNGRGREITGEIVDLGRGEIRLRKLNESETPPLRCRIALGQAIPKGKNMELIVQKAVEIGAAEI